MASYENLYQSQITGFANFIRPYYPAVDDYLKYSMVEVAALLYDFGKVYGKTLESEDAEALKKLLFLHPSADEITAVVDSLPEDVQQRCAKFLRWLYHFAKEFIEGA